MARIVPDAAGDAEVASYVVTAKAGDAIYRQGDTTTDMYIIQEGEVEVVCAYAGTEHQAALLEAGDFFGEMSLLGDVPREGTARAKTDCTLLKIGFSTFDQIVRESPEIPVRMLYKLSRRLREHEEAAARAAQVALGPLAKAAPEGIPVVGTGVSVAATMAVQAHGTRVQPTGPALRGTLVHADSNTIFELPDGREATVGRFDRSTNQSPDVDLTRFDTSKTLSRRHARIGRRGDTFYVREEVGVRNGTSVNGRRLANGVDTDVHNGDVLRFGLVEVRFQTK